MVAALRTLASELGEAAEGTRWLLFGSADRDDSEASDIDLMILCTGDGQADALRASIDPDALPLPLHLALMTYEEAAGIDAVRLQRARCAFEVASAVG